MPSGKLSARANIADIAPTLLARARPADSRGHERQAACWACSQTRRKFSLAVRLDSVAQGQPTVRPITKKKNCRIQKRLADLEYLG